jgi:alkylation response protein AidB-like acyl-CoA dehydrogenase
MTALDLTYTDTEDALRDSVRSLLAAHCPSERVAAMYDGDATVEMELWEMVSRALELPGLGVAESLGGGGAAPREVAVVMEELGRSVAPIPFLTSSVIATRVLAACGADELVRGLVDGSRIAALAVPLSMTIPFEAGDVRVSTTGVVDGRVRAVAGAERAGVILVPALRDGVLTLLCVEPEQATTTVTPRSSLDMSRPVSDLTFASAGATELARGPEAERALESGLVLGAAMLASEQLGIAEWCLETTVEYVKQRKQFGRSIGSFQAIKHRLARLWIEVDSAGAAARNAAAAVGLAGEDALTAVLIAQAHCSDTAVLAAEECVQMHGGIGMTWEHPAHLYLKRAKADQLALGTSVHHRATLARLQGL